MEERQPAQPAGEYAGALLVEENTAEWRFRTMLEEDVLLFLVEVGH